MARPRIVFNHVGLCIADTARSRRFYEGLLLELLAYSHRVLRTGSGRVMDQVGLTHLSLSVSDLGKLLAAVESFGGSIVEGTVTDQSAMVRDPDGQLLELLSDSWLAVLPPRPGGATNAKI